MPKPVEIMLNDFLLNQNQREERYLRVLEGLLVATQQKEADKVARKLRPYTVLISAPSSGGAGTSPTAIQVVPRNPNRRDLAIYNIGPGDLLWSNTNFDPTSILQQISDPAHPDAILPPPNVLVEIGLLSSGASTSLTSNEAVWVYNVGGTCTLSMIDTVFQTADKTPSVPGMDGVIGQGYNVINGIGDETQLVKGLR